MQEWQSRIWHLKLVPHVCMNKKKTFFFPLRLFCTFHRLLSDLSDIDKNGVLMDLLCVMDHNRDATMAGGWWSRMASGICENAAGFSESAIHKTSFSPVFWVLVNLISLPIPPSASHQLSVSVSQVTPVVWWHTACPISSWTRTLWTWVEPPTRSLHLLLFAQRRRWRCVTVSRQERVWYIVGY